MFLKIYHGVNTISQRNDVIQQLLKNVKKSQKNHLLHYILVHTSDSQMELFTTRNENPIKVLS